MPAFKKIMFAVAAKQDYETRQIKTLVHGPEGAADREATFGRSVLALVNEILRLRQKITSIKDSVTGLFKGGASKDTSSQKLDAFKGGRAHCLPAGLGGLGLLLAAEGLLALGGS
jgi:hypothetical protein